MKNKGFEAASAEISASAISLSLGENRFDPAPILSLLRGADIVGLGESTHGDAFSLKLKKSILERMLAEGKSILLAWERSAAQIQFVGKSLRKTGALTSRDRRWIYPWVSREMDAILDLIRKASDPLAPRIDFVGVDIDNLGPPDVYRSIANLSGTALAAAENIATVADRPTGSAYLPDELESVQSASAVLLEQPNLSHTELRTVQCAGQWSRYMQLRGGTALGEETAYAFRDRCIAQNVLSWHASTTCDVTVLSAHNGHISRDPWMAGGHISHAVDNGYFALGVAFGEGQFNAGSLEPDGRLDRELRVFDAENPPKGSLERHLTDSGIPAALFDLRAIRDPAHVLSREMLIRETTLDGNQKQFTQMRCPRQLYDGLVWIKRITPAALLRH